MTVPHNTKKAMMIVSEGRNIIGIRGGKVLEVIVPTAESGIGVAQYIVVDPDRVMSHLTYTPAGTVEPGDHVWLPYFVDPGKEDED